MGLCLRGTGLALSTVIPGTMRYLHEMSKDEASYWLKDNSLMLANPIQFESDHPDMIIDEMVELYESYYLVEPIEEKWGRWGSWKCMCESFISE